MLLRTILPWHTYNLLLWHTKYLYMDTHEVVFALTHITTLALTYINIFCVDKHKVLFTLTHIYNTFCHDIRTYIIPTLSWDHNSVLTNRKAKSWLTSPASENQRTSQNIIMLRNYITWTTNKNWNSLQTGLSYCI